MSPLFVLPLALSVSLSVQCDRCGVDVVAQEQLVSWIGAELRGHGHDLAVAELDPGLAAPGKSALLRLKLGPKVWRLELRGKETRSAQVAVGEFHLTALEATHRALQLLEQTAGSSDLRKPLKLPGEAGQERPAGPAAGSSVAPIETVAPMEPAPVAPVEQASVAPDAPVTLEAFATSEAAVPSDRAADAASVNPSPGAWGWSPRASLGAQTWGEDAPGLTWGLATTVRVQQGVGLGLELQMAQLIILPALQSYEYMFRIGPEWVSSFGEANLAYGAWLGGGLSTYKYGTQPGTAHYTASLGVPLTVWWRFDWLSFGMRAYAELNLRTDDLMVSRSAQRPLRGGANLLLGGGPW